MNKQLTFQFMTADYAEGMEWANRDFNLYRDVKFLRGLLEEMSKDDGNSADLIAGYREGIKLIAAS